MERCKRTCRGKYSELFDNSKNGYFKNRIIDKINIEKRDEFTEVIEIYADGDKDNPTYLDIKDESAEQLQKFETLIIENLLPQKKVISYNKNGAVYEKIPNQIDIEA